MLPVNSLDTQSFADIVQISRKLIQKYAPEWTDENAHDPGITILELLAWLKEMQQFYIDQIGDKNRLKMLKLLCAQLERAQAAVVNVSLLDGGGAEALPEGVPALAGSIPFESAVSHAVSCVQPVALSNGEFEFPVRMGERVKCYAFGRIPAVQNALDIYFDKQPLLGGTLKLYVSVYDEYGCKRNPIAGGQFRPLADVCWQVRRAEGFCEVAFTDETYAFLQSGFVTIDDISKMAADENGRYTLRCTLLRNGYDLSPLIHSIEANIIPFVQKQTYSMQIDVPADACFTVAHMLTAYGDTDLYYPYNDTYKRIKTKDYQKQVDSATGVTTFKTVKPADITGSHYRIISRQESFGLSNCLGMADGFPGQVFSLDIEDRTILYDGFALAVADDVNANTLTFWEKADDLDHSLPTDKHYMLDEATGDITFGDGIHGCCPRGFVCITSLALTYGERGNIMRRELNTVFLPDAELPIVNHRHAIGGRDKESIEDAFERVRRENVEVTKAATAADYETLVKRAPGLMIAKAKAYVPDEEQIARYGCSPNAIMLAVLPYAESDPKMLPPAYIENITTYMEDYRLIGTEILVQSPEFVRIEVFAEIVVKPYYLDARKRIQDSLETLFSGRYGEFSADIRYEEVYGTVDILDCVERIVSLSVSARGNNVTRTRDGAIILPPNGLITRSEYDFILHSNETRS